MPRMSGPDLQQELARRQQTIPIVFITAHNDPTVRPRMLEQGAVECLFKPFSEKALLDGLFAAIQAKMKVPTMPQAIPTVFVVDDDISVRESLELLIRSAGWEPEMFASAQAFLDRPRLRSPRCLVLDSDFLASVVLICRSMSRWTGRTCRSSSSRASATSR